MYREEPSFQFSSQQDCTASQEAEERRNLRWDQISLNLSTPKPEHLTESPQTLKRVMVDDLPYKKSIVSGRVIIPPVNIWKNEHIERNKGKPVAVYRNEQNETLNSVKKNLPVYNEPHISQKNQWKPVDGEVDVRNDEEGELKVVNLKKGERKTYVFDRPVIGMVLRAQTAAVKVSINDVEYLMNQWDSFRVNAGDRLDMHNTSAQLQASVSLTILNGYRINT